MISKLSLGLRIQITRSAPTGTQGYLLNMQPSEASLNQHSQIYGNVNQ